MRTSLLISTLLLTISCSPESGDSSETSGTTNDSPQVTKQQLIVRDSSLYDPTFIEGLKYVEPIELTGNYIIVGDDSVSFPSDIPLNQVETFSGVKGDNKFELTVKPTNLTTLTYNFRLTGSDSQIIDDRKGKAVLGSMFFLGSETDDDIETDDTYGAVEYWDADFSIRIGERDENGKLRAKVKYKALSLENCPTLRTK